MFALSSHVMMQHDVKGLSKKMIHCHSEQAGNGLLEPLRLKTSISSLKLQPSKLHRAKIGTDYRNLTLFRQF